MTLFGLNEWTDLGGFVDVIIIIVNCLDITKADTGGTCQAFGVLNVVLQSDDKMALFLMVRQIVTSRWAS